MYSESTYKTELKDFNLLKMIYRQRLNICIKTCCFEEVKINLLIEMINKKGTITTRLKILNSYLCNLLQLEFEASNQLF